MNFSFYSSQKSVHVSSHKRDLRPRFIVVSFFVLFLCIQGFRQDFEVSGIGWGRQKGLKIIFFLPQKQLSRASRTPPCQSQSGKAKLGPQTEAFWSVISTGD